MFKKGLETIMEAEKESEDFNDKNKEDKKFINNDVGKKKLNNLLDKYSLSKEDKENEIISEEYFNKENKFNTDYDALKNVFKKYNIDHKYQKKIAKQEFSMYVIRRNKGDGKYYITQDIGNDFVYKINKNNTHFNNNIFKGLSSKEIEQKKQEIFKEIEKTHIINGDFFEQINFYKEKLSNDKKTIKKDDNLIDTFIDKNKNLINENKDNLTETNDINKKKNSNTDIIVPDLSSSNDSYRGKDKKLEVFIQNNIENNDSNDSNNKYQDEQRSNYYDKLNEYIKQEIEKTNKLKKRITKETTKSQKNRKELEKGENKRKKKTYKQIYENKKNNVIRSDYLDSYTTNDKILKNKSNSKQNKKYTTDITKKTLMMVKKQYNNNNKFIDISNEGEKILDLNYKINNQGKLYLDEQGLKKNGHTELFLKEQNNKKKDNKKPSNYSTSIKKKKEFLKNQFDTFVTTTEKFTDVKKKKTKTSSYKVNFLKNKYSNDTKTTIIKNKKNLKNNIKNNIKNVSSSDKKDNKEQPMMSIEILKRMKKGVKNILGDSIYNSEYKYTTSKRSEIKLSPVKKIKEK